MAWSVEFQAQALEDMRRLDKPVQRQVLRYLRERIEGEEDLRRFGKALTGNKVGLWRYRPGDIPAIHALNAAAFGQPAEADLVDRLRATGALTLSLVAEEAGEVVGQRRLTRVKKGIMHLYATCRQSTFVLIGLTPLPGLASERTPSACG